MRTRRLLVALDASPGGRHAAELTVRLASLVDGELVGLFVEDERVVLGGSGWALRRRMNNLNNLLNNLNNSGNFTEIHQNLAVFFRNLANFQFSLHFLEIPRKFHQNFDEN